jgi:putative acetyltransferase
MTPAMVTLRPAEAGDEPALRALWCAAWDATYPAIDYQARWPAMWERWQAMQAEIHIALRGRDVIGMLVIAPAEEGLLVDQITLPPAEQGSGTAHLLMNFAKRKGVDRLTLSVNAFNRRAIRFYEREGFKRTGSGINATSGLSTFDYEWRR